eukprot:m.1379535 g.1379535  ORF g.1379535 m.1379535 type:complete len:1267 (-) comp24965_c1_seq14:397-4197(-)
MDTQQMVLDAVACTLTADSRESAVKAYEYIEHFKDANDPLFIMKFGEALVTQDVPAPTRWQAGQGDFSNYAQHFGLQLIEHVLRHRWKQLSSDYVEQAKQVTISLFRSCQGSIQTHKIFVVHKISSNLVEVALHEWPQHWPTFIEDVMETSSQCSAQLSCSLIVLRILAEEIHEFHRNYEGRRQSDLVTAVETYSKPLMEFLASTMSNVGSAVMGPATASGGLQNPDLGGTEPGMVLTDVLKALQAYISWVDLQHVYDGKFLPALCDLLQTPSFRKPACECLLLCVTRKGPLEQRMPLLSLMSNLHVIVSAVPKLVEQHRDVDAEDYAFFKRLCLLVSSFASSQLCSLWSSQGLTKEEPANYADFLGLLLQFLGHRSLLVSSLVIPAWQSIFRNDETSKSKVTRDAIPSLLQTLFGNIPRMGTMSDGFLDDVAELFCTIDFDCDEEFLEFFGGYRGEVMSLIRLVVLVAPNMTLQFLCSALAEIARDAFQVPLSSPADGSRQSRELARWDAVVVTLASAIGGALHLFLAAPKKYAASFASVAQLLEHILQQCTQRIAMPGATADDHFGSELELALGTVDAVVRVLPQMPESTTMLVLHVVLDAVTFGQDSPESTPVATGLSTTAKVRRKACLVLRSLCNHPPPALVANFAAAQAKVVQVLQLPNTSEMSRRLLIEAAVQISNNIPAIDAKTAFLQGLLGETVKVWCSDPLVQAVSSTESLIAFAGLFKPDAEQADAHRNRQQMVFTAQMLDVAFMQTGASGSHDGGPSTPNGTTTLAGAGGHANGGDGNVYACVALVQQALPTALRTIRTLHSLWEPGVVPAEFLPRLGLRHIDRIGLLSRAGRAVPRALAPEEVWLDRIRLFLSSLREACYGMVKTAARVGVLYHMDEFLPTLAQSCFHGLPCMHPQHMSFFLKLVAGPIASHAPRTPVGMGCIVDMLAFFYGAVGTFLQQHWAGIEARRSTPTSPTNAFAATPGLSSAPGSRRGSAAVAGVDAPSEARGELDEILEESLLGNLTSSVASHLSTVISVDVNITKASMGNPQGLGPNQFAALDKSSGGGAAVSSKKKTLELGLMAKCIFTNSAATDGMLELLSFILTGLHSRAAQTVAEALNCALPLLVEFPSFIPYVRGGKLMCTALFALGRHGQHDECRSSLLGLVAGLYRNAYDNKYTEATDMARSVPGTNLAALADLDQLLISTPKVTNKSLKSRLKTVFDACIGKNVGEALARPKVTITNLPEKLLLRAFKDEPTDDGEDGLAQFFSDLND